MKNRAAWRLYISAALFYSLLLANRYFEWGSPLHSPLQHILLMSGAAALWMSCLMGFFFSEISSWVYVLIVLIPIEFSYPFWKLPSLTPIDFLGMAAIAAFALKNRWMVWKQDLLTIFGAWTLSAWISFFLYACLSAYFLHGNLRGTFRWGLFLFGYLVTAKAITGPTAQTFSKTVCRLLAIAGSLIGALAVAQYITSGCDYMQVTGTFRQHNSVGMFLSLCLPAAWYGCLSLEESPIALRFFETGLILIGLILCYSRGAWMGLVVGSLTVFMTRRNIQLSFSWIGGFVFALVIIMFIGRHIRADINGRNWYLKIGFDIIKAHPWFGLGPGNYASQIKSYLTGEPALLYKLDLIYNNGIYFWIHLHNLYLQYLVEYGLTGATFFFCALGLLVSKAFRSDPTWLNTACLISIIGFLVHNLVDILAVNSFDVLFGILIALAQTTASPQETPLL